MNEKSIKEHVTELRDSKLNLKEQLVKIEKQLTEIQKICPHENKKHYKQEYTGSWSTCLDCGKEDI